MSLQVCNAPGCKKITVMEFCDEHVDTEDEDDVQEDWRPAASMVLDRKEERLMGGWSSEARERHRAKMAEVWAKRKGQPLLTQPRVLHEGVTPTNSSLKGHDNLPSRHTRPPITLAEPTVVNGEHGLDIDVHIGQLESDLAMLRGAKAIMEGYRA